MAGVRVAIDGPVAAGKSTVARALARRLSFRYLDTGAMYRALAWASQAQGIGPSDETGVRDLLAHFDLKVELAPGGDCRIAVDGRDITTDIRTQAIGELASALSALPFVREWMVRRQQALAAAGDIVAEGRDIQTVVIPDAEVKIFLTASEHERADRNQRDRQRTGESADAATVLAELRRRDTRDSTRAHAPLRAAPDAVTLDSTGLTVEDVVERIAELVQQRERTKT